METVRLGDTAGRVRVLNVVNSLDTPVCHVETQRLGAMPMETLPPEVCVYTGQHGPALRAGPLAGGGGRHDTRCCPPTAARSSGATTGYSSRNGVYCSAPFL